MKVISKNLMKKTIISVFIILILLSSVIPPKCIYALDQKRAGETVAQFAINFHKDYASEVIYDATFVKRKQMYDGEKCSDGKFHCDCVGWISFVMHQSLGLNTGGDEGGGSCFVAPKGIERGTQGFSLNYQFSVVYGGYDTGKKSAKEIIENALPGDIILADYHVMLYIGNGEVIHCANGLQRENLEGNHYAPYLYGIARITDETASGIRDSECTTIFGLKTGAGELDDYGLYWGTTTGRYTGSYTLGDWLFSKIGGFLDYLLGILTYIIKIPFLGYTNITEAVVNDFLQQLSGDDIRAVTQEEDKVEEETNEGISAAVKGTKVLLTSEKKLYKPTVEIEKWERVTIEDIIFNRVPIFDVDIFNFKTAAGQEIGEESIIYQLRKNVASWYLVIRNAAVISMLIILLYLGIRLAITSSSEKKANYKKMLVAWFTGLIVIYVIHYYMILVVNLNQSFLQIFENMNGNAQVNSETIAEEMDEDIDEEEWEALKNGKSKSLYDTIRTRAYSFKLSEGIPATIIYMVLVYYLIKYVYMYLKRYLTVNVLALLAPVIGAKYAYDNAHKGKSGGNITSWMFDFFVNVFLQTIHAMIYTIFISIVLDLATTSLAGFALSLLTLNFMQQAEKIFISIFKFEGKGGSLSDTRENDLSKNVRKITSFAMVAASTPKVLWGGTKFLGGALGRQAEYATNFFGFIGHGVRNRFRAEEDRTDFEKIELKKVASKAGKKVGGTAAKAGKWVGEKGLGVAEVVANVAERGAESFMYRNIPNREPYERRHLKDDTLKFIRNYKKHSLKSQMKKYKDSNPEKYNAMKKALETAKKQRQQQRQRMIKTGTTAITGAARVAIGIPMLVVEGEAGAVSLITGISALRGIAQKEEGYGYLAKKKNLSSRIADINTLGMYSASINEIGRYRKDTIENSKMLDKLNALSEMSLKEDEIDDLMKEIDELEIKLLKEIEKTKSDEKEMEEAKKEEEKARRKRLNTTLKEASNEVISGNKIKAIVDDYMFENNIEKLSESDVEKIAKKIEQSAGSDGVKVEFDSGFKSNVKRIINEKNSSRFRPKKKYDKKDTVDVIEEAVVSEGSVKSTHKEETNNSKRKETKEVSNIRNELNNKYIELKQSVKQMHGIAERAKVRTGSEISEPNKYIKKVNTKQIANRIREGKKGGK